MRRMNGFWSYWYFHIPNFVLAAVLYTGGTLLGFPPGPVGAVSALAGFALRGAALYWGIELPAYSREKE